MAWITGQTLAGYLAQDWASLDGDSQARFTDRAAVAAEWCLRRRSKYGYTDTPDVAPNLSVAEGTHMFAAILLRAQGAYDGALSFSDFGAVTAPTGGSWGQVQRLLGVPRRGGVMDLEAARAALASSLNARVRTVTDPRAVVAPCALVELPTLVTTQTLGGGRCSATCTIPVTLIAAANDPLWLMRHLVTAMDGAGATEATATAYFMGDEARLPAYTLLATVTVTGE